MAAINNTTSMLIPLKVTVLGDPGTGKQTFLKSLQNNKENEFSLMKVEEQQQLLNSAYKYEQDQFYEVFVRDFKNNVQIVFQFTSDDRYLQQSVCCILMYDISNYQSFVNLKKRYLELAQNQMIKDHSFLYIVGNKMDLENSQNTGSQSQLPQFDMSDKSMSSLREVEFDEAQEFAQSKGILFNEVSSLKRKNIELVLKMLRTRTARLISENKDLHIILDNNGTKSLSKEFKKEELEIIGDEDDEDDLYSKFEYRMISQEEKNKKSYSNLNTQQSLNIPKQLDTAHFGQDNEVNNEYNRRQLLSSILESKFYKSNESPGRFEVNAKEYQQNDNESEDIDVGFGMDETDNMEDDKLLQSLEKRLRNLDEKKSTIQNDEPATAYNINTDQSPTQYKEDQLFAGQTPQFQMPQKQHQQPVKQSSSILDELQNAMKAYNQKNEDKIVMDESGMEDRIQPYSLDKFNFKFNGEESISSKFKDDTQSLHNKKESNGNNHNDTDFLKNLDNDIKRTEESLKEMNDRFQRIKQQQLINSSNSPLGKRMNSISPIKKKSQHTTQGNNDHQNVRGSSQRESVPIFEASLFKSFDSRNVQANVARSQINSSRQQLSVSQMQSTGNQIKSRNQHQVGLMTDRASIRNSSSFINDHKERPLISLRIKLSHNNYVSASIYKDDTAMTVADRVFRHSNMRLNRDNKDQRKMLSQIIEEKVNAFIYQVKEETDKEVKEMKKMQKQTHQQEREKRLQEAAQRQINSMNTAKRMAEKEEKKSKVIGKLSVIVGANKKGDIVVREGDNINLLVKSFMVSYGLKKELMPTIIQSLEQLVKSNEKKKSNQYKNGQTPGGNNNLSISMEEHELKFAEDGALQQQQQLFQQQNSIMNSQSPMRAFNNDSLGNSSIFGAQNNIFHQRNESNPKINNTSQIVGALLFRLNFELGEGKSAKINVREGDNFQQLSQQFAQQHGLGEEAVSKVLHLIEQTYKIHKQKKGTV